MVTPDRFKYRRNLYQITVYEGVDTAVVVSPTRPVLNRDVPATTFSSILARAASEINGVRILDGVHHLDNITDESLLVQRGAGDVRVDPGHSLRTVFGPASLQAVNDAIQRVQEIRVAARLGFKVARRRLA